MHKSNLCKNKFGGFRLSQLARGRQGRVLSLRFRDWIVQKVLLYSRACKKSGSSGLGRLRLGLSGILSESTPLHPKPSI